MKVILGISNSGKTTFVKKYLIKSTGQSQATLDPKRYYYRGDEVIDTPCLSKYKNIQDIFELLKCISDSEITHVIFFYQSTEQNKILSQLLLLRESLNFKVWINNISTSLFGFGNVPDDVILVNTSLELRKLFEENAGSTDLSFLHRTVNSDTLRIIFLGATNAGKSSLINSIVGQDVLTVDAKRHTTLEYSSCIKIINGQKVELFDSFGLEKSMRGRLNALSGLISTMDYSFIVSDVTNYTGKLVYYISSFLNSHDKSYNVILNKSDLIQERSIVKDIFGDLAMRLRNIKPILTNVRKTCLLRYIKSIKKDNFAVNMTQITKAVRARDENVIYVRQNLSSRFYHFIIYTRKRKLLNMSVIRNIIVKYTKISNYHIKLEVFEYESKEK